MPINRSPRWAVPTLLAVAVLTLLALAALSVVRRLPELGATAHRDEAIAWTYAALPLRELPEALSFDVNPPVYFAVLHGWLALGEDARTMRWLSVAAFLIAAVLAGVAAKVAHRGDAPRAGWVAAWIAAALALTGPAVVSLATLARPYALAYLLGMMGLLLSLSLLAEGIPRWRATFLSMALGIVGGLTTLTHYWGGLLFGALVAALVLTSWLVARQEIATRAAVAAGSAFLVLLGWLPWLLTQLRSDPLPAHGEPDAASLDSTLTGGLGGLWVAWVVLLLALSAGSPWFDHWWPGRRAEDRPLRSDPALTPALFLLLASTAATGVVLVMWGVSQARPLFTTNYGIILTVPLPVTVAVLAAARRVASILVAGAIALGASVLLGAALSAEEVRLERGPEPWIAGAVSPQLGPDDVVVLSPGRVLAVRYAMGGVRGGTGDRDDVEYRTPIGSVEEGRFDFRDRVGRLEAVDPDMFVDELAELPAGTRVAVVHDRFPNLSNDYWIALDEAMSGIINEMGADDRFGLRDDYSLPYPYLGIDVEVFVVRP